ncbi:sensor histidine kinase [Pontibacillus litoralis]|uniref:histidine kinase n=1 Tax=Pontibacillus litoralis JSM 072002 TaxID=1385512 RepID=A0A0A5G4L8_9BACI|nr:sensor histidine kinase [Pontibacillus litoralis]KGX86093.1 sensor histidine kinase [Pontibacillus litoralis JSM 072002]
MRKWYQIIPDNIGLSSYVWIVFCLLPFFFIFRASTTVEMIIGIVMIALFFLTYRLSFISNNHFVYLWVSIEIAINIMMIILFGYVYFSLFLAFFIGNIEHKGGFISLYVVHLATTIVATTFSFFTQTESLFPQMPFIIICIIGVILLPFSMRYRNKRLQLEGQLEDANERIAQLMIIEERERIARDLHDTLGQKLSMIGLKSDLARKLMLVKPEKAVQEINDIRQTASTALKEVREMVANMKGAKLEDEIIRVQQIIQAAEMDFQLEGNIHLTHTPLLVENVLSMCLKEAATNIVKHSNASKCRVSVHQTDTEVIIQVQDDGIGISGKIDSFHGHGLQGMKERLEFVNGSLEVRSHNGTTLNIRVPNIVQQMEEEESI